MKKFDVYEIAIKITGVYLLMTNGLGHLNNFLQIIYTYSTYSSMEGNSHLPELDFYRVLSIVNMLLILIISLLFIFKTGMIVRIIGSSKNYEEQVSMPLDRKSLYEIAILMTGLILLIWTLPEFSIQLRNQIIYMREVILKDMPGWHTSIETTFLIVDGIKIIVALFAIVSARPLASFFAREKRKGMDNA